MSTIYTRATKGSALTWTEGDANITNLNNDKIEDIVEDLTPQLGGDLDVNGNSIVSAANGNISINPNGTGKIILDGLSWPTIDGSSNQVLKTDGAGNLSFSTVSGGATTLDGLSDVNTSGAMNNHVLKYNSTATEWQSALLEVPTNLDSLTDVTVSAPSDGQVLKYNNAMSRWENGTASGGIASVSADLAPQLGGDLELNGKKIIDELGAGEILLHTNWIYFGKATNTSQTNLRTNQSSLSIAADATNGGAGLTLQRLSAGGGITLTGSSNGNISITPAGTGQTIVKNIEYNENIFAIGTTSGTIAPDVANGNVQSITLNGNLTLNAFTSPVTGQSLTLIVKQDATGSRTLTSTMKFAGGSKTLTTAANSVDIITVLYDGTNYWASLGKDFK